MYVNKIFRKPNIKKGKLSVPGFLIEIKTRRKRLYFTPTPIIEEPLNRAGVR